MSDTSRIIPIVGAHFRPPAKALLASLPSGQELRLLPEPANEYDENAVAVYLATKQIPEFCWPELDVHLAGQGFDRAAIEAEETWHLGYLPKSAKGDPEQEAENREQQLAVIEACTELGGKSIPGALTFTGDGKPAIIVNPWPPIEGIKEIGDADEEDICEDCGNHLDDCTCDEYYDDTEDD